MWNGQRGVVREGTRENRKRFVTQNMFGCNTQASATCIVTTLGPPDYFLQLSSIAGIAFPGGGFREPSQSALRLDGCP